MSSGVIWVVAGALQRGDGKWLMHRRPFEKHHGGLWEFPGGKVEDTEIPVKTLIRELHEELGITINPKDCEAVGFAEEADESDAKSIVILLYKIRDWSGEPHAIEGEGIGWFTQEGIAELETPPLDRVLAQQLFTKT